MTENVQELVRRAFGDIIDAAGDLGPCPSSNEEVLQLRTPSSASGSRRSRSAALSSRGEPHRWATFAAGLLVVLGMGAVLWATQRPDGASEPVAANPANPRFLGTDLDLSLPVVGRGWAESMDFTLSRDTNARLYAVWQTEIAACMNSRGFPDFQPVPYPANGSYEDLVNPLDRRYAAVRGYHELPAEPVDPNTYSDASRAQAADCASATYERTWGRISAYTNVNDQLRNGLSAAIEGFADSDAGRAVTAQWASCMSARGHKFESRSDAIRTFTERPTISTDEITTRLDDLECDTTVGYTQTQHDWEQSKVTSWRDANSDAIATATEQKRVVDEQLAEIEASQRSPAGTLTAANEVPLTFESVDIQTAGQHWDTEFNIPDARPFYVGTAASLPAEPLDRCVGRGEGNALTAGCATEGPAVTQLVVESSGVIDTIVWDGLPANTSYVVLDTDGTVLWQQPALNLAAFAATWCTVVDVCPYTLIAYDMDGQPLATATN